MHISILADRPTCARAIPTLLTILLSIVGPWPAAQLASAETTSTVGGERPDFMRGVVVSCPRAGQIWGSPEMEQSLRELKALGVRWVSIHPYAGVHRDGGIRFRSTVETPYLARAAQLVADADMKLFLKPHIAYWGSFEWRGAIDFGEDGPAWDRFFDGYARFIVDQARFAEANGVPLFSVGVEYERTTRFDERWRQVIASVREVYSGRITYAANWDSLHKVSFWDAVDLIGVNAYFPLADRDPTDREAVDRAWSRPLEQLSSLSHRQGGKPVVFAEIGYARSPHAASAPWQAGVVDTPPVRALRKTLIDVALVRIEQTPFIAGMFWWKWIPGNDRWDRDFSMKDTEAREALTERWTQRPGLLIQ